MDRPAWVGPDIDLSRPSPARVYDVHLGGAHNFQVDRDAARRITEVMPELPRILRANRAFLRRAVRFLVDRGITQFLDLGSGIPTAGNVHEVAWSVDPACRIVYVDVDPVAVAHSRAILGESDRATAIQCDLRLPREVLTHPEVLRTLDFTRPVGVLMFAVLHFVPDADKPAEIIREYLDATAPGSYLALSHASLEGEAERAEEATEQFRSRVTDFSMRTRGEIGELLGGVDLVEPGVVYLTEWRPEAGDEDPDPKRMSTFAAVGRKTG
ncbi:SAM-dependent methyltransferase [Actinosynnema sp. NPDC051121]|nr:hypothetical protein [Saccharothrix sp.]